MKKWYAPDESNSNSAFLAFQMETEYEEEQPEDWNLGEEGICPLEEPVSNPKIEESNCISLSLEQMDQLRSLLGEFPEVLRSVPGGTHLVEHEIHVGEASPIHQAVTGFSVSVTPVQASFGTSRGPLTLRPNSNSKGEKPVVS